MIGTLTTYWKAAHIFRSHRIASIYTRDTQNGTYLFVFSRE